MLEYFVFTRFIHMYASTKKTQIFVGREGTGWALLHYESCCSVPAVESPKHSEIQTLPWVHLFLQMQTQLRELHLHRELCLNDGRFQQYLRLTQNLLYDLLLRIGDRISLQDTEYRTKFLLHFSNEWACNGMSLMSYVTGGSQGWLAIAV